ncbi:FtsL-like putative cell division protein [Rhizosphaericola mali]|uniref:S-adenosyl-methyltransferase n=1 Tax=Rhizosphaericola mali TaxID=2545455 RepID=A0A5P2G980_9BACT|nr:FtsL-like putative cell division protein [Rhizosphaericola mali]QES90869.1 hypothetical protein E0W69_020200 [Rhizosphaericola mali]
MEEQITQEKKSAKPLSTFKKAVNYQWVMNNLGFFLFLAFLAVIYIANGHVADKIIRETNTAGSEIKELQFEYKTLKSELMFQTKEAEIIKAVAPLGLKLSSTPPMRIKLIEKNKEEQE